MPELESPAAEIREPAAAADVPATTASLTIAELERAAGLSVGPGPWHVVEQGQVDLFAEATQDRQWIHVDPEAAASGPFGGTVAHGYLTLALLPMLLAEVLDLADGSLVVNYGIDRIRFPAAVPVGSRIRLQATLVAAEPRSTGLLCRLAVAVELDGSVKPALVGEVLYLVA